MLDQDGSETGGIDLHASIHMYCMAEGHNKKDFDQCCLELDFGPPWRLVISFQ